MVQASLDYNPATTTKQPLSAGSRAEYLTRVFPGDMLPVWTAAIERLESAGYGHYIAETYKNVSLEIAEKIGPDVAIEMANTVSITAIKSGVHVAQLLCQASLEIIRKYSSRQSFSKWLELMDRLALMAPESTVFILKRTGMLSGRLSIKALESWVWTGMRIGGGDAAKRLEYFKLQSPEALRALVREIGEASFSDFENEMKAYLAALYGFDLKIIEAIPVTYDFTDMRPTFSHGVIRIPATLLDSDTAQLKGLLRASLAHIGAHFAYSNGRILKGSLRPIQIATVSLIEDARVEHLAMRDMPGLRRIWQPFHTAELSKYQTAPNLFACLARALIDPDFEVDNGWIKKAVEMFYNAEAEWGDQELSRRMGNVLGNDLGQMRIQLNAKNYVVQPAYRDDNMGLWDFGDQPLTDTAETIELQIEAVKPTQSEQETSDNHRKSELDDGGQYQGAKSAVSDGEAGRIIAHYPEFDFEVDRDRPDWTTIQQYQPMGGTAAYWTEMLQRQGQLIERLKSLIKSSKISEARKYKRQIEGDDLDIDACISVSTQLKMGQMPDPGIYEKRAKSGRELAVNVLLDISQSTAQKIGGGAVSILELALDSVAVLACAMEETQDKFAVNAFCSAGRDDVRYYPIKGFEESFTAQSGALLSGLNANFSTRMGAAIRHAGAELERTKAYRRLVLLVSDGEPSDIDCTDTEYLEHDARRAIQHLSNKGIDVFCVGLGGSDISKQISIFGRTGFARVNNIQALPEKLAALYLRLSR